MWVLYCIYFMHITYYHKRFERLNITHQRTQHSRYTSFLSRKIYYLKKPKSFKKSKSSFKSIHFWKLSFIFEISLEFLKVEIFSFEILLKLLKFLIFFLNANLPLELLNSFFEFWSFLESFRFVTKIRSLQHNGSYQVWSKDNRTEPSTYNISH